MVILGAVPDGAVLEEVAILEGGLPPFWAPWDNSTKLTAIATKNKDER